MLVVLLVVVALAAVLLGMSTMHASMAAMPHSAERADTSSAAATEMPAGMAGPADTGGRSDRTMGDMDPADCLLLGMACFFTAVAVLLLAILVGCLGAFRPRTPARPSPLRLGRLGPPRAPSLLVLSISRT